MARSHDYPDGDAVRQARARSVEGCFNDYRQAFLLLLKEPFEDLDRTIARMLEVLATTLDVDRVGFWTFDEHNDCIRCEHFFSRDGSAPLGVTLLRRVDCPAYFAALCQELVVAADNARLDPRTVELTHKYLEPLDVYSLLDVPVRAFGRYLGVLCHESVGAPRFWSADDENFASSVASHMALAFERDRARQAQEKLLERSLRDDESQLANRLQLEQAVDAYLQNPARVGALVAASIDQYNYVASSLGARRRQLLLRQFAARLVAAVPEGTIVARVAGNDFALLLRNTGPRELPALIEQIVAAVRLPFVSETQRLFLTLSVGFSTIEPALEQRADSLIAAARTAALEARSAGGDRAAPFTELMRHALRDRIALEQDLRRALDAMEFELYFQPIVPLGGVGTTSLEALLRWRHPQRGVLAPAEFMDVAISSGIMLELGRRVLSRAAEALAQLRAQPGLEHIEMTVNMSAPEMLLPGTADAVKLELLRHQLPPRALTLEITETAFMIDLERAAAAIAEIRALGVCISLDDFGTAYSSLSWLRRLPIDKVKIDRSYVCGIEDNSQDLAIVKSIVDLARAFGRDVVAEGVETQGQLAILRSLNVGHVQGYLFARPAPIGEIHAAALQAHIRRAL